MTPLSLELAAETGICSIGDVFLVENIPGVSQRRFRNPHRFFSGVKISVKSLPTSPFTTVLYAKQVLLFLECFNAHFASNYPALSPLRPDNTGTMSCYLLSF